MKRSIKKYSSIAIAGSIALFFSFSPPGDKLSYAPSTPVGTIEGEFKVDQNGGATYNIKIEVPPGINTIEPQLSLVYNSQLGNGKLGLGWDIQGLSAIERIGATNAQDGFISNVNYGNDDRLIMDGQRLILTDGSRYGANGSVYHTEIETWSKVVLNGDYNDASTSITVTQKKRHTAHLRRYG